MSSAPSTDAAERAAAGWASEAPRARGEVLRRGRREGGHERLLDYTKSKYFAIGS